MLRFWKFSWLVVCLALVNLLPLDSFARDDVVNVTDEQCSYRYKLEAVFVFKDEQSKALSSELLARWQEGVDRIWNSEQSYNTFGDGNCRMTYSFDFVVADDANSCSAFRNTTHCVAVVHQALNKRGKIADMTRSYVADGIYSYGEWTTGTTGIQAAHLAGHMLGLDEDYRETELVPGGSRTWSSQLEEQMPASIMAQTWDGFDDVVSVALHTEQITEANNIICNSVCYCGDGLIETDLGERCDTLAVPTGCGEHESCNSQCLCEARDDFCGDGIVNGDEECDVAAESDSCAEGTQCNESCACETVENAEGPQDEEVEYIHPVCGDGICSAGEQMCTLDCRPIITSVCGDKICEGTEAQTCMSDCE